MKARLCSLALGATSLIGVGAQQAQACDGCRSYYSYQPCPSVVVAPVVRETTVLYHYPVAPVILAAPTPVAPTVAIASRQVKVPQGAVLRLKANFLGNEVGHVILAVGSVTMECQIQEWSPQFVIIHLPQVGIMANTPAQIVIATKNGIVKRRVDILLSPTADVEVVPSGEFVPRAPKEVFGEL